MRLLALVILTIITACAGGGSSSPPAKTAPTLPPFTQYSTDLAQHPSEGTIGEPLKFGNPLCKISPFVAWQQQLCTLLNAGVWTKSNAFATTLADDRWRVVVNVENAWDTNCNTGPPAQSFAHNEPPITVSMGKSATIGFELANEDAMCSKVPYVALTYIRGVQGDGVMRMAAWGSKPILSFDGVMTRTIGPTFAQAVHFWIHLRATDGTRYMAHTHLWQSGYEPPDFRINWNWPAADSYYYPGAWIHGGDSDTCPGAVGNIGSAWSIDLEALATCRFPEFLQSKPDILGFEIAAEGAYLDYVHKTGLPNRLSFTVTDPRIQ